MGVGVGTRVWGWGYLVLSHLVLPYLILSHFISSYLIFSHLILLYLISSHPSLIEEPADCDLPALEYVPVHHAHLIVDARKGDTTLYPTYDQSTRPHPMQAGELVWTSRFDPGQNQWAHEEHRVTKVERVTYPWAEVAKLPASKSRGDALRVSHLINHPMWPRGQCLTVLY